AAIPGAGSLLSRQGHAPGMVPCSGHWGWMRGARSSRAEYLMRGDSDVLALPPGWIPDQWEKSIFPNGKRACTTGISSCA
ncbi:hypothetical protein, partial [Ralstonia solanacearum]